MSKSKPASPALSKHLKQALPVATQAALLAGKFLKSKFGKFKTLDRKQDSSLVTEADRGAEKIVSEILHKKFPLDEIFGEEYGFSEKSSAKISAKQLEKLKSKQLGKFRWHIDPLDGTTNFVHGFPMFCVSIGLEFEDMGPVLGVIYSPISGDLYQAHMGGGAKRNGKTIRVTNNSVLGDAVLTTGFSYRRDAYYARELQSFGRVLRECRALRRIGSAALDLAFTASGQFDGFWERGLSSWDVAAGTSIMREAGGKVTNLLGNPFKLGDEGILATNENLHSRILDLINSPEMKIDWRHSQI